MIVVVWKIRQHNYHHHQQQQKWWESKPHGKLLLSVCSDVYFFIVKAATDVCNSDHISAPEIVKQQSSIDNT